MDDERVVGGAAFDLEDALDGLGIERIGGQAVNRFGGQGDQLAGAQKLRGAPHGCPELSGSVCGQDLGCNGAIHRTGGGSMN